MITSSGAAVGFCTDFKCQSSEHKKSPEGKKDFYYVVKGFLPRNY